MSSDHGGMPVVTAGRAAGSSSPTTGWDVRFMTHWSGKAPLHLEYKNHLEVNYCIEGEGEVVDFATGTIWPIRPGTMYALDKHDRHILRATKGDLRLVCTFSPALSGRETHDADGSYRLAD
jgi:hypothetical protein